MTTVAVVQARMGSSRLPGKMMYPLDGRPVVTHVLRRVQQSETLDSVVVAVSDQQSDDVLATQVRERGVSLYRGSEHDVLGRLHGAAHEAGADEIVRVCGDTPLVAPRVIDALVRKLRAAGADYVYTMEPRSFPRGLDVEAFTAESFDWVADGADEPYQREHVTVYYREHAGDFSLATLTADEVFDDALAGRTDLRLTLDEAADYELLRRIYRDVDYDGVVSLRDAVAYVDTNGLATINEHVEQRSPTHTESN